MVSRSVADGSEIVTVSLTPKRPTWACTCGLFFCSFSTDRYCHFSTDRYSNILWFLPFWCAFAFCLIRLLRIPEAGPNADPYCKILWKQRILQPERHQRIYRCLKYRSVLRGENTHRSHVKGRFMPQEKHRAQFLTVSHISTP